MKRIGLAIGIATSIAAMAGACHDSTQAAQERQAEICAIGCDCFEPGNDTCVGQCSSAQGVISNECGDCILQNSSSCALVEACEPHCRSMTGNMPGGGGSGSGSGSAAAGTNRF